LALQRWSKQVTGVYTVETFNQQAVYTFPAIPQGFAASVSVAVPGSGAAVDWTVLVSGQIVGSTLGAQPCGPIYLGQGDVLSLVGDPITNVGVAVASGAIGLPTDIPPASIITNNAQGIVGANLVAVGSASPSAAIPLNGNVRGILVLTNPSVYPTGPPGYTGLFLPVNQNAMAAQYGATGLADGVWFLPTAGLPSVQVAFSGATNWQIYYVEEDFDFYEVARGLGVYTVTVPNPAPGADWSYVLPAPGRLLAVQGLYEASATAVNRLPRLTFVNTAVGMAQVIMVPISVTASEDVIFTGFPTAALAEGGVSPNLYGTFPYPDLLLPAGATIASATLNIATTDQWAALELTLSPI
jgi:hypothetical protein